SGNGTKKAPHAPLFANVLCSTVSLRPPDSVMPVPVGPMAALPAAGAWALVSKPSWLWSNCECVITIAPPEFVPEYPSALYSIQALEIVTPQSCLQPPT